MAGLLSAGLACAVAAQAAPVDESFLADLDGAGFNIANPVDTVALGQSICPMLSQPAATVASTASTLTGERTMPAGMAGMFTNIAVSMYCPQMLSQLSSGQIPELPQIPGMPAVPALSGLAGQPGLPLGAPAAPGLPLGAPSLPLGVPGAPPALPAR